MRSGLEFPDNLQDLLSTEIDWPTDLNLYPIYLHSWLGQGRGIGRGSKYLPWLTVRDVPSMGNSSHIWGVRTGRKHHLLSKPESIYFRLLERRKSVVAIQECWPILDIASTYKLCERFGTRHPQRRGFPDPVTIDFLIKVVDPDGKLSVRARAIKTSADSKREDVLQALSVQHAWCESVGLPWELVDATSFSDSMLESLKFIRLWFQHGKRKPEEADAKQFAHAFLHRYARNVVLDELIANVMRPMRMTRDQAIQHFRYTAWTGAVPVDVQFPIAMNSPLVLTREV
ncbi:MAG: hypothetical protein EOP24_26015 [Hyphomicrobiales bacterium]|nr:MAG: hypothetical protein EOP24_26015 [Hyphomicrobiales bacterium]